jgi:hypothetical protein
VCWPTTAAWVWSVWGLVLGHDGGAGCTQSNQWLLSLHDIMHTQHHQVLSATAVGNAPSALPPCCALALAGWLVGWLDGLHPPSPIMLHHSCAVHSSLPSNHTHLDGRTFCVGLMHALPCNTCPLLQVRAAKLSWASSWTAWQTA